MKASLLITLFFVLISLSGGIPMNAQNTVDRDSIKAVVNAVQAAQPQADQQLLQRGIEHAASLWRASDGDQDAFLAFCLANYHGDPAERKAVFKKINDYFEALFGHNTAITIALRRNVDEPTGPIHEIDRLFASYSQGAHLMQDLYENKIAFLIALNFPYYSLEEKNDFGSSWSAEQWAMARLGDLFVSRIPAEVYQHYGRVSSAADLYISAYNIHMGALRDNRGRKLFRDDQVLLSHWNLRDEIKANYADRKLGRERQEMVYRVMERIIDQSIPAELINSDSYLWNPIRNTVEKAGRRVSLEREPDTRYAHMLELFRAQRRIDAFSPHLDTHIKRNFSGDMEVPREEVERLFDEFLSSPLLGRVAELVQRRLGRKLRPYDIWYDGFKTRSSIPEEKLSAMTRERYPDAAAFEAALPGILETFGFSAESAAFLSSRITVDPARGSGHAWGTGMRAGKSHLRTRIAPAGMDYKGFNIAVHEFGHNVEQTISMHLVPYYFLNGVPNTSFTEALAFLFQKRDLEILGMQVDDPHSRDLAVLDNCWSAFEIMGVSMVDMKVWQWLYANPEAEAGQLRQAVMEIAREVWNKYFAAAYGSRDETVLAIYSHMISYPLYLSAYAFGQLIEFQLGEYLADKPFGPEVKRIWAQGRLTPSAWMIKAVGADLSAQPLIRASTEALQRVR